MYLKNNSFFINRQQFISETDKEIDGNNFLVAYDVPIAKTGIQQYTREEIGDNSGSADEFVNVYRPIDIFEDEELLQSFDGIPIVYRHPDNGKIDNNNFKEFVVGTVSGVYHKNGNLFAKKLTIIDKEAIRNVLLKNTNELSIGFRGKVTKKSGKFEGIPYQFVEDVIHANHLALCESGKAGSYYAINSKKEGNKMKECMSDSEVMEHNVHGLIEQAVKKQLARVKPINIGNMEMEDSEEEEIKHAKKKEEVAEKHLERKHGMDEVDSTSEELKESEHHDKDVINSLKRQNRQLKDFINKKNTEIRQLELQNISLEEALYESREYMKNMAAKIKSSKLTNAMTAPDDIASPYHPNQVHFCNSLTSSFLRTK